MNHIEIFNNLLDRLNNRDKEVVGYLVTQEELSDMEMAEAVRILRKYGIDAE